MVLGNATGPMHFVFRRLYPSSPQQHSSVWVLLVISLLLTNTVLLVQACLIIWWESFRGTQKEDDRGPLTIQSCLVLGLVNASQLSNKNVKHLKFLFGRREGEKLRRQ
jgi:hypothetical protein